MGRRHAISDGKRGGARTARDDLAGELVAGDDRPLHERILAFAIEQVAITHAARRDAHAHLPRARLRQRHIHQLEPLEPARFANLNGFHTEGALSPKSRSELSGAGTSLCCSMMRAQVFQRRTASSFPSGLSAAALSYQLMASLNQS